MAYKDTWSGFEDNENSWFALWSDARYLGCALLLLNENLADDPLFNHVTRIRCEPTKVEALVGEAVSLFREHGTPPSFYVTPLTYPEDLDKVLRKKGFKEWGKMDVRQHIGDVSAPSGRRVEIRLVDAETINTWVNVFTESFEIPPSQAQEYLKRSKTIITRSDTDFLLAYVNGKTAGCIALYSKNRVGGGYCLGTLHEFRRRGVASSLLEAIVERSTERGNDALILQALRQDRLEEFYSENSFGMIYTKSIYIQK